MSFAGALSPKQDRRDLSIRQGTEMFFGKFSQHESTVLLTNSKLKVETITPVLASSCVIRAQTGTRLTSQHQLKCTLLCYLVTSAPISSMGDKPHTSSQVKTTLSIRARELSKTRSDSTHKRAVNSSLRYDFWNTTHAVHNYPSAVPPHQCINRTRTT